MVEEDKAYLISAKKSVDELSKLKKESVNLKAEEKKKGKVLNSEEKSIKDEINSTLKKRKSEIEGIYDDELSKLKSDIKKQVAEKEARKSKQVEERINLETDDLNERNKLLKIELKNLFHKEGVPQFCASNLYYRLFMPKGIKEKIIFLLSMLAIFIVIPVSIGLLCYFLIFSVVKNKIIFSVIFGLLTFIIFVLIYNFIRKITRLKHRDILLKGRIKIEEINANNKIIKNTKISIKKDNNDERYGLEKYNEKIAELKQQMDKVLSDKKDALDVFENSTKIVIIDEINERRNGKLEELKRDYNDIKDKILENQTNIEEKETFIKENYENNLGKEYIKSDVLDILIQIMEKNSVTSISEAIFEYRKANMPEDNYNDN